MTFPRPLLASVARAGVAAGLAPCVLAAMLAGCAAPSSPANVAGGGVGGAAGGAPTHATGEATVGLPGDVSRDGAGSVMAGTPAAGQPSSQRSAPLLRLPPASLGRTLNLEQQITVQYPSPQGEQTRDILALLEADAGHTRLAAIAGGQVLARLDWDGHDLRIARAPWAPAELVPERILSDLQLSLWPVSAIEAALPAGWRLEAAPGIRRLCQAGEIVAEIRFPDAVTTVFEQRRDGYRLTIRTLREGGRP